MYEGRSSSHCISGKVKKPHHFFHILCPIFIYNLKQKQLSKPLWVASNWASESHNDTSSSREKIFRLTVSKTPSGKFQLRPPEEHWAARRRGERVRKLRQVKRRERPRKVRWRQGRGGPRVEGQLQDLQAPGTAATTDQTSALGTSSTACLSPPALASPEQRWLPGWRQSEPFKGKYINQSHAGRGRTVGGKQW